MLVIIIVINPEILSDTSIYSASFNSLASNYVSSHSLPLFFSVFTLMNLINSKMFINCHRGFNVIIIIRTVASYTKLAPLYH